MFPSFLGISVFFFHFCLFFSFLSVCSFFTFHFCYISGERTKYSRFTLFYILTRHLDSNGKYKKNENVIAFGLGTRRCIGEKLARIEFFVFTVRMLQRYRRTGKANLISWNIDQKRWMLFFFFNFFNFWSDLVKRGDNVIINVICDVRWCDNSYLYFEC